MKVKTICSGSKGNCTIVSDHQTQFFIDMGISYLNLKRALSKIDLLPEEVPYVLLTHSHNDHMKGLASLINQTNAKCYIPKEMYEEVHQVIDDESIVIVEDEFDIMDFHIQLIHTSHDTACSVGYLITNHGHSLVYITDTGYINHKYLKTLKNCDIYIMESNHDEQMLMEGPYPYYLKQRVISDKGHLSNHATARYLREMIGDNTKYVVLAHLSEKNNTEELAKSTVLKEIETVGNCKKQLLIARQDEEGPYIEV